MQSLAFRRRFGGFGVSAGCLDGGGHLAKRVGPEKREPGTLPLRLTVIVRNYPFLSPMSPPLIPGERFACKAFTLIELLTVIAIIGVLAAITFGVVRGVGEQSKRGRATAELSALSSGLVAYKGFFGDYPWVGNDNNPDQIQASGVNGFVPTSNDRAYNFLRALGGRLAPKRNGANGGVVQRQVDKDGTMVNKNARSFVDFTSFSLEREKASDAPGNASLRLETLPISEPSVTDADPDFANAFIDPWGNRYLYYYKTITTAGAWKSPSYILFSAGPDGLVSYSDANKSSGKLPDPSIEVNADNVYATP